VPTLPTLPTLAYGSSACTCDLISCGIYPHAVTKQPSVATGTADIDTSTGEATMRMPGGHEQVEMGQQDPGQRGAAAEQDQGQDQGQAQGNFNPLAFDGLETHGYDANASTSTGGLSASASASAPASHPHMGLGGLQDDYTAACKRKGAQLEPPLTSPSPSRSPKLSSMMGTWTCRTIPHDTPRYPTITKQPHNMQGWFFCLWWSSSPP